MSFLLWNKRLKKKIYASLTKKESTHTVEEPELNKVSSIDENNDIKSIGLQKEFTQDATQTKEEPVFNKVNSIDENVDIKSIKLQEDFTQDSNIEATQTLEEPKFNKVSSITENDDIKSIEHQKEFSQAKKIGKTSILKGIEVNSNELDINQDAQKQTVSKIHEDKSTNNAKPLSIEINKNLENHYSKNKDGTLDNQNNSNEKKSLENEGQDKSSIETENLFAWTSHEKVEVTLNKNNDDELTSEKKEVLTETVKNSDAKFSNEECGTDGDIECVQTTDESPTKNSKSFISSNVELYEKDIKTTDNDQSLIKLEKVNPIHKKSRIINKKNSFIAQFVMEVKGDNKLSQESHDTENLEADEDDNDDDEEEEEDNNKFSRVSEGVWKKVIKKGFGRHPKKGDQVSLHCVGYIDSEPRRKFWDTHELGQRKFSFKVDKKQVIKGFDEAAISMKLYEISSFKIDSKKAYGKFGFDAWEIPPNSDLLMEFELINIKRIGKNES